MLINYIHYIYDGHTMFALLAGGLFLFFAAAAVFMVKDLKVAK
jgi:hypothetical protein